MRDDYKILDETKELYKQKNHFSREQIKEHSILFIMIHNPNIVKLKTEELSDLTFTSENNNNLKNKIINLALEKPNLDDVKSKIEDSFKNLVEIIEKNSILKNIIMDKNEEYKLELLEGLLREMREMNHLKKIEILENKIVKNLDENSYSELIKLKSQLNRE